MADRGSLQAAIAGGIAGDVVRPLLILALGRYTGRPIRVLCPCRPARLQGVGLQVVHVRKRAEPED